MENTELKNALKVFLKNNDVECIVMDLIDNDRANVEKSIDIMSVTEGDITFHYDIFFQRCCNSCFANIEITVRKFNCDYGRCIAHEKICLYDYVNDTWDSIMATEQYTEQELLAMPEKEYNALARETIISDISDIICFAID